MASVRTDVRSSVRQIISDALLEDPRPSTGEIARRIRTTFAGPPIGGTVRDIVPAPRSGSRVLPTQRARLTDGGSLYIFSSERAALIARTEMAQAENEGIVEGYRQSSVRGLKWLAYNDGRTGDRRHNEMKGVTTPIGVPFILPDGTPIRFPGDPNAPIKHTANCRCTVAPVLLDEDMS